MGKSQTDSEVQKHEGLVGMATVQDFREVKGAGDLREQDRDKKD
jgi:hypothetical protein